MITASSRREQYAGGVEDPSPRTSGARTRAAGAWQRSWREAITDPRELLDLLELGAHASRLLPDADTGFAVRVPRAFAARMRKGDPACCTSTPAVPC